VVVITLVLGGTAWRVLLRQARETTATPAGLLDAIAALDARYLGQELGTSAEEWNAYQAERRRLKTQLEAALAAGQTGR